MCGVILFCIVIVIIYIYWTRNEAFTLFTANPVNLIPSYFIDNTPRHVVYNSGGIHYVTNHLPEDHQLVQIDCPKNINKYFTLGDYNYCWKEISH